MKVENLTHPKIWFGIRRRNRRYFPFGLIALLGLGMGVVVVYLVDWLISR